MKSWPHFTAQELSCKCGECDGDMDDDFMDRLEEIRTEMGVPFILSSAYRCPAHNDKVSSTGFDGPHTTGKAVDILISGDEAYHILDLAFEHGMTGLGISQKGDHDSRFIHLDTLTEGPRPWIWSY